MKDLIVILSILFSINTAYGQADTLHTKKDFLEIIENKLNKYRPNQVVEFRLPGTYTEQDSLTFRLGERIQLDFKPIPVARFINLIELYNCKLITYSYLKGIGLFRIGSKL